MDTYLIWALNSLFQELLDPLTNNNPNTFNTLFQSLLAPASQPGLSSQLPGASSQLPGAGPQGPGTNYATAMAPMSAPTPEAGAADSVQAAIQSACAQTGLSPDLLKAVATVESGLNPSAESPVGAIGLMQLMPGTAQSLGVNPYNVSQNALGGAEYLKGLLNQFGQNLSLALAAYNAGPGAVDHYGGIPPYQQTEQYVKSVLAAYQSYGGTVTPEGSSLPE